jgi:invasion protein IalB
MMTISSRAAVAAFASFMLMGSAFAQGTAAPAAPAAKTEKAEKAHTPESLECSKQADEKGLHGKERKKFRSECKRQAKDAAKK